MQRLPFTTLSVLASSLLATGWTLAAEWLVYDRHAIQAGEVWRLVTGHLVHWSAAHLYTDLLAFGITGMLIERVTRFPVVVLYASMAGSIGVALWLFDPALSRFSGLSGLAYGNGAYLALWLWKQARQARFVGGLLFAAIVMKCLVDLLYPTVMVAVIESQPFLPVPLSHSIGVLTAALLFISTTQEHRHVTA